jgi:hypothetical protein
MENENENDIQYEYCEYCDKRATEICDNCGAMICDEHTNIVVLQFGRIWVRCIQCVATALT